MGLLSTGRDHTSVTKEAEKVRVALIVILLVGSVCNVFLRLGPPKPAIAFDSESLGEPPGKQVDRKTREEPSDSAVVISEKTVGVNKRQVLNETQLKLLDHVRSQVHGSFISIQEGMDIRRSASTYARYRHFVASLDLDENVRSALSSKLLDRASADIDIMNAARTKQFTLEPAQVSELIDQHRESVNKDLASLLSPQQLDSLKEFDHNIVFNQDAQWLADDLARMGTPLTSRQVLDLGRALAAVSGAGLSVEGSLPSTSETFLDKEQLAALRQALLRDAALDSRAKETASKYLVQPPDKRLVTPAQ